MNVKCYYCGNSAILERDEPFVSHLINCPSCGRYKYMVGEKKFGSKHRNEVASYLFYNGVHIPIEEVVTLFGSKKQYILLDNNMSEDQNKDEWFERVSIDQIIAFNKLTLSEKTTKFLLMIAERSNYYGEWLHFDMQQLYSALFVLRFDENNQKSKDDMLVNQSNFIISHMDEMGFINVRYNFENNDADVTLKAAGWELVDELQRNSLESSKNVFVAMSFSKEMKGVRESIRAAINECGYNAVLMDELQHNHQIVPEMLYEIRQAKFVVAELTEHNNGAYYEAGYALGVGKEVIQLCSEKTFGKDGHFDVKQINTILWNDGDDLKEKLVRRIKATIE